MEVVCRQEDSVQGFHQELGAAFGSQKLLAAAELCVCQNTQQRVQPVAVMGDAWSSMVEHGANPIRL